MKSAKRYKSNTKTFLLILRQRLSKAFPLFSLSPLQTILCTSPPFALSFAMTTLQPSNSRGKPADKHNLVALPSLSSGLSALPQAKSMDSVSLHPSMYAQRAAESEAKVCTFFRCSQLTT